MQAHDDSAPRVIRLSEGVYAQVVERTTSLPRRLEPLLSGLRVTRRHGHPVVLGTRLACTNAEHPFSPWLEGIYAGLELRLALCPYCGVVEVRDASLDILPDVKAGHSGPRRRDDLLGWYSGQRPAGRTYL
jgi:hypothetical protein